tara:strand:- start:10241 stop:11419 length:1179 start_codon:yes stop_codon:yes gene_type:complete
MAENNVNNEVETSAFTPPEKTELERLQERIANYKVQITPSVAQMAQLLMTQALQQPTKPEELDGYITVRNELNEGLEDYKQQVENAQKRVQQLTVEHEQQKQIELARREQDLIAARDSERKRRKTAETELQKLEAVLASHGINIDLDGDGEVGVPKTLKQAKEQQSKGVSPAFAKARALNPAPTIKEEVEDETLTITLPVGEDALGTADFVKEVEQVATMDSDSEPVSNKPVITDSNAPAVIEEELAKEEGFDANGSPTFEEPITEDPELQAKIDETKAAFEDAPKVRLVEEDDIAEFETPPASDDDELVEVTIPTESELKGMTKSKIQSEALALGFDNVTTKSSKTKMIADFVEATESFIADLQDSGEFVSARDEDETEDSSDDRDGGYFK